MQSIQYFVKGPDGKGRYCVTSGKGLLPDGCYMLARDHFLRAPQGSRLYRSDADGCIEIHDVTITQPLSEVGHRMLRGQQPGAEIAPGVYVGG